MQDWEQYYGRSSTLREDPWALTPEERRRGRRESRRPALHNPREKHTAGSCASAAAGGSSPQPRPVRSPRHTAVFVVILLFIITGTVLALASHLTRSGSVPEPESGFSGDDNFSVNVDPDASEETPSEPDDEWEEQETGPSEMDRYEGGADFALNLHSSQGLEALSYQEIYAKVAPSVVTITVYGDTSGAYATGIVLSEDGFILTNQHVVACQRYAQVTTMDNMTYDALLVGEDPNSDLALLKVEADGLIPAQFGLSEELVVGDECFAIGNPLGINYRGTFSNGIISALNRNVSMNGYSMTLIQTTAALNSGNSGGPLINIYGQVIGVNNMKIMSSSTTVEGLGFAIPSATAQKVTNLLATDGVVEHPVIGITCYGVTAGGQEGYEVSGILVVTVGANTDAYAQGLREGDIITALNGQAVYQVGDVDLSELHVGDTITLTVWREGESFELEVALMEQNALS